MSKILNKYEIYCAEFVIDYAPETECSKFLFLHDGLVYNRKVNINFHVKAGDYFGTLATILDILCQDEKISAKMRKKILNNLQKELMYLQDNYLIIKK